MGKQQQRRKDAQLDKRALRKKAEHQGRALEVDAVEERESNPQLPQRWNDNSEPKRERKKNKKPKETPAEEVCCTITTVPFIDESQKLDQATGHTQEESKPKKETKSKRKLHEELEALEPFRTKIEILEKIVEPEPIVYDIPVIPTCTSKKMTNFMRKQRYKRPEKIEEVFDEDAEIERVAEMLGKSAESVPSNLAELKEFLNKESERVKKKKSDTTTSLKQHFEEANRTGKAMMKKELLQKAIEQVEKTDGLNLVKPISINGDNFPKKEIDGAMRQVFTLNENFLKEIVDLKCKTNKCNEVYIRLLNRYKIHKTVADSCHAFVKEKSKIGRKVLINQIKLLDDACSNLSTKGLKVFSRRESTALKDWQRMVFTYANKKENYEQTIESLSQNLQEAQTRRDTNIGTLKALVNQCRKDIEKRTESQRNYEDRVVTSDKYKKACRNQERAKDAIMNRREQIKEEKVRLEEVLERVRDVGTKPPNYDHLVTKWCQTREEIAADIHRTAELREKINSIQEGVRSKAGQILELQVREDELTRELNTTLDEKAFVNRQFHIEEYQRKKLNLKYYRIQYAH